MNEFPELRDALLTAAERSRHQVAVPAATDKPLMADGPLVPGTWVPRQVRAVVLAVICLLVAAAVALAAAGVFSPGRPVAPVSIPNPRSFDGAVIPSTIRLSAVRAADPGGGPQWGLRLVSTTRGEVCVTPGRVAHGLIGVLGRDRAFGNDGRLHPFARDYIAPGSCALPDAGGHAFLSIGQVGLPASALIGGAAPPAGGCQVDNPPPANRALLCPKNALRDVYYGLLGPDATNVTYRTAAGRLRTEQTAGPDGAYLIVLPYTGGLQGNASVGVGLTGPPFVSVSYRNGSTCRTAPDHICQPVGYQPPYPTNLTDAAVRAAVTAHAVPARSYCNSNRNDTIVPCNGPVRRGFSRITGGPPSVLINISFTARVPVTNSHTYYEVDVSLARSASCTVGGLQAPTTSDIAAGQRIHIQDLIPLSCSGLIHGSVRYVQSSTPGSPYPTGLPPGSPGEDSVLVGRFELNPTSPRPR